ncbi:MAG: hypothetical protein ACOCVR_01340, partial [Myxococcota bacterium]
MTRRGDARLAWLMLIPLMASCPTGDEAPLDDGNGESRGPWIAGGGEQSPFLNLIEREPLASGRERFLAEGAVDCDSLPTDWFLDDATRNLLGLDPVDLDMNVRDTLLFEEVGLGTSAEGLFGLVMDLREGLLDEDLWPSLAGLSLAESEATVAAALIEIDPDFHLDCRYFSRFPFGASRTITELALLVNASQGRPVPDADVLTQHFHRKALVWEIASAYDLISGARPMNRLHSDRHTLVVSPVVQLLAAFRGAHMAFHERERPWAHRPFNRPHSRFDLLVALVGLPPEGFGLAGENGATIVATGTLGGTSLRIPAGAIEHEEAVLLLASPRAPNQSGGRVPLGPVVDIQPDGLALAAPAILTLPVSPQLARIALVSPGLAEVSHYDSSESVWAGLPSEFLSPRSVRASIDGFSLYQGVVASAEDIEVSTLFQAPGVDQTAPVPHPKDGVLWSANHVDVFLSVPVDGTYYSGSVLQASAVQVQSFLFSGPSVSQGELLIAEVESLGGSVLRYEFGQDELTRLAGHGMDSESEGIPGADVRFGPIRGLATDSLGNIYVAEERGRVRRVDAHPPHLVTTVA